MWWRKGGGGRLVFACLDLPCLCPGDAATPLPAGFHSCQGTDYPRSGGGGGGGNGRAERGGVGQGPELRGLGGSCGSQGSPGRERRTRGRKEPERNRGPCGEKKNRAGLNFRRGLRTGDEGAERNEQARPLAAARSHAAHGIPRQTPRRIPACRFRPRGFGALVISKR